MIQCEGQLKFEFAMTFKEKMESEGWHNVYDMQPNEPGIYKENQYGIRIENDMVVYVLTVDMSCYNKGMVAFQEAHG